MLILVLKRPKNDFLNSVRILVQKTKKTRFYRKFCHFLKIHEKSRFLGQILEIFAVFLAFFNEKVVSARQRTVEISMFWKKFSVPTSLFRDFRVFPLPEKAQQHRYVPIYILLPAALSLFFWRCLY